MFGFDFLFRARPGVHHAHIRKELQELPGHVVVLGKFRDQINEVQIVLGVLNHAVQMAEGIEGQIPVVELHGLLLEFRAGVKIQHQAGVLRVVGIEHEIVIFHEGGKSPGLGSVGPSGHFHLEQAQIQPQLHQAPPIGPHQPSCADVSRIVRPALKNL